MDKAKADDVETADEKGAVDEQTVEIDLKEDLDDNQIMVSLNYF